MSNSTDLSRFNNSWYSSGRGKLVQLLWYFINVVFIKSYQPFSGLRIFWLKTFGAKVSGGVVIKPGVNIKYPWRLSIGSNTWIGEQVWIDNLDVVEIGANCCLSQGAMLMSGNHDYKSTAFDLMIKPIVLEDGVWIGAKSLVTQGVTCESHSVLAVQSVTSQDLKACTIYRGNPAAEVKKREIITAQEAV